MDFSLFASLSQNSFNNLLAHAETLLLQLLDFRPN